MDSEERVRSSLRSTTTTRQDGNKGAWLAPRVFRRPVRLLRLAGMWPAAPSSSSYRLYSALTWLFLLGNALGELGGLVMVPGGLEKKCQSMCSWLFRMLGLADFTLFIRHVRPIQDLLEKVEGMADLQHGGLGDQRVEALQQRARRVVNNLVLYFALWFTYSSTGVVTQPLVEWSLSGQRPRPFLSSNFWLVVEADSPVREALIYLSQSLVQYTSTVVVVGHSTFFAGMAIYMSYQAKILCVLLETIPFSKSHALSEEVVRRHLVHCITFHQDILNAAKEINRLVRESLMLLIVTALSFIATMIYQIVAAPSKASFMATVMILICTNLLLGVYSFSSDRLQQATAAVVDSVMASDWPEAPLSSRSLLVFMVFRAAKPSALWCWVVFSVSLPTWVQVLNKSYSVFAVMRSSDK